MKLNHASRRWPWLAAAAVAACLAIACPAAAIAGPAGARTQAPARTQAASRPQPPLDCGPPDYVIRCYSPQAYEVAYGVAPLLGQGIDGRGETVVMPELAETQSSSGAIYTDIRQDLATFDTRFGLPAAALRVVNTAGSKRSSPPPVTPARSATRGRPGRSACPPPTRWCWRSAAPPWTLTGESTAIT